MDDVKSKISKFTNKVTRTSGELLKTTKLSVALANEEDKLKNLYLELGRKVHEIYMYGGSLGGFFDEKYEQLKIQDDKVKALRNELDSAKGTKTCANCGKSADKNAEFCSKCGSGMAESRPAKNAFLQNEATQNKLLSPEPTQTEELKTEHEKICPVCKSVSSNESKFCLSCGRALN